jgi:DNA-binding PadR family transcriptional regulator
MMFSHETEPGRGRCRPGPHRHRRHGFGPGPFGEFGGGPWGGFGRGPRGRGRKARRGDIRTASLLLLAEEPRNGYQIMQEVEDRSEGWWRPSPGSVYPALSQLEDEGLIRSEEVEGRKLFALTDAGRELVQERGADKPAPWEQQGGESGEQTVELARLMREVVAASVQVIRTGSDGQLQRASELLTAARRDLYRILADGDADEQGGGDATVKEDS